MGADADRPADRPGDEELLARFVAGDRAAFGELVARHRETVYAICWRYWRDDADAEDAAQETFLAVHRGASSFRGTARFTTWLYRVATNTCNDLHRKRVRRPRSSGLDPERMAVPADDEITALETDLALRDALAELRPAHREVLVLHVLEGVPYADIAAHLDIAMGTVKSRLHRATAELAEILDRRSSEHPLPPVPPKTDPRPRER